MKTYYIIEANGYRTGVQGRAVMVHEDFKTFYHIKNGFYIIRCRRSGLRLGHGHELAEAKQHVRNLIDDCGINEIHDRIEQIIENFGPGKGGGK